MYDGGFTIYDVGCMIFDVGCGIVSQLRSDFH